MFGFLEKFVIKRLLKKIVSNIPEAEDKLEKLWAENSDKIFKEILKLLENIVLKFIEKATKKEK